LTYSIVARDPKTGEMGVAVQSHYFSVGSVVPWARSGVGAVATQSMSEISYGPLGLDLMAAGKSATEALSSLLESDSRRDTRQVGFVDSIGRVSTHTGARCIDYAGHIAGEQFSCQANLMSNASIWSEMAKEFKNRSDLELPERLVATLEAAESAGGDARGKQSAALIVVGPKVFPNPWMGRVMELRVEDSENPLPELKRLVRIRRAYDWADKGDDYLSLGKVAGSKSAFKKAEELAPENEEIRFWAGITLLGSGLNDEDGLEIIKGVFARNKNWMNITRSLMDRGYLSKDNPVTKFL
jgi:uncharacterized Ntn-hydrolase superfamily protein